jgi:hypothetical protein
MGISIEDVREPRELVTTQGTTCRDIISSSGWSQTRPLCWRPAIFEPPGLESYRERAGRVTAKADITSGSPHCPRPTRNSERGQAAASGIGVGVPSQRDDPQRTLVGAVIQPVRVYNPRGHLHS